MYLRTVKILFFVLLIPAFLVACGMKKGPDEEQEKKKGELRTGAQVYESSILGNEVYTLAGSDARIGTSVVPSLSAYDYMDRVKKTLGRESKINVDENCFGIVGIGQTDPMSLEIDIKVDQECASLPEGEPSHTDPSPLDGNNSWIICGASDSGGIVDGPGTEPPGGGPGGGDAPSANADNAGGSEKPAAVGALQNILCTPAIGPRPDIDPRLVYPAPNQVDAMIAELAPCIAQFCPWKLIPVPIDPNGNPDDPLDPQGDPTDPIDPSPDDVPELTDEIKSKLPCDVIKSLCEPDITLISKNDLVKQDPKACDDKCDGVCTKKDGSQSAGESCTEGDPSKDEDWTQCGTTEVSKGSVCTEHKKGSDKYTVTHGAGVDGKEPSVEEQEKREQEALDLARHYSGSDKTCNPGSINKSGGNKTSFDVTCN